MRPSRRRFALVLLVVVCACQPATGDAGGLASPGAGGVLLSDLSEALRARGERIRDFSYRGVLERDGEDIQPTFLFESAQPGRVRLRLEQPPVEFRLDGRTLALIDESERRVLRRDLSAMEPAARLLALHQVFDAYSIEGWRALLLRGEPSRIRVRTHDSDRGPLWILEAPLEDENLAFVRYEVRRPRGDFLRKEFVTREGSVLSSAVVIDEWSDSRSGLRFPSAWQVQGPAGRYRVRLRDIRVNEGIPGDRWSAPTQPGYTTEDLAPQP